MSNLPIYSKDEHVLILKIGNWVSILYPTGNLAHVHNVHNATLTIKYWKQSNCPMTDEQITMSHAHTMEYYLALKRNEVESFVEILMDLVCHTE